MAVLLQTNNSIYENANPYKAVATNTLTIMRKGKDSRIWEKDREKW